MVGNILPPFLLELDVGAIYISARVIDLKRSLDHGFFCLNHGLPRFHGRPRIQS